MKIGIITVTRNDRRGLELTLKSVIEQISPPVQLLVVDGASSDGTSEWLRQQDLPDFVTWVSEPDRGIYDAMNKGIRRIEGEFVMFLNSGDRLAGRETLSNLSLDQQRNRWQWAYGRSRLVHGEETVGIHELDRLGRTRFLWGLGTIPHQSVLMSSEMITRVGEFRLDVGLSADQEFLLRAWRFTSPRVRQDVIAICDATGVTSRQPVGAFSRQMAQHRRLNSAQLGPAWVDRIITLLGVAFDLVKTIRDRMVAPLKSQAVVTTMPSPRDPGSDDHVDEVESSER